MQDVVKKARELLSNQSELTRLTTNKVRRVSSILYRQLDDKSLNNIIILCEKLLDEREWALGVIAYDWAFRSKDQYEKGTFDVFQEWLFKYVTGWGDCDDFCTHAFGELLCQYNDLFARVIQWTKSENYCVRRAAAVILIYPIRKNRYENINPLDVSDAIMQDEHHLVQKGYGWMLKVFSQQEQDTVYSYLIKNKTTMPRTAFRYALEKFDMDTKKLLMKK